MVEAGQGFPGATQGRPGGTLRTPHLQMEKLHFYTSGFPMRFLAESQESHRKKLRLTHGGCVRLGQAMLAGQGHLGGRRIGPVALEEAAECNGEAQHNDLEARREHGEL